MGSIWKPSMTYTDVLYHSAKGTTWKEHKYIKKIGNTYIYAKKAAIAKRNSKNARKEFVNEYNKSFANIDQDISKNIERRIVARRDGGKREYYKKGSLYDHQELAADNFLKSERNDRWSRMYAKQAKKELSSIPKEIINDGKKLYNSILSKIRPKKKNKSLRR